MPHPDGPLIRRMLCGPIGSAKLNKLTESANYTADHLSDRLGVYPHAESAPGANPSPPLVPGAPLFVSIHAEQSTSQVQ